MKYVYVIVGNESNIFVEQAWASVWSLLHYNRDAYICVVTDEETKAYIDTLTEFRSLVSEIKVVRFGNDIPSMDRSRWLKTKMRELVEGDFTYIDCDTIVTGNLSDLDDYSGDVYMVEDMHVPFEQHYFRKMVIGLLQRVYGKGIYESHNYYNGGFALVRDTGVSHDFFNAWHNNWKKSASKGINIDQIALLKTCLEFPNVVKELPGIYNCQLSYSIQFLHKARIVHFQKQKKKVTPISPFYEKKIYEAIKKMGKISPKEIEVILDCKSVFTSPSSPVSVEEFCYLNSKPSKLLEILYNAIKRYI